MASATLSGHGFADLLTSNHGDSTTSLGLGSSIPAENTKPATLEELEQTTFVLDTEIQEAKSQMYKKLLANYDSFSDFFERSLELKDKIDDLLLQTAELSEQAIDPESGLRQTIMASLVYHHEASYKVQENDAIVDGLQHFFKIDCILTQYGQYMDAGKILDAGQCIQKASRFLSNPPNAGTFASYMTKLLTDQCSQMTEAIDQMLDELVAGAIFTGPREEEEASDFKLELLYNVKVPHLSLPRHSKKSTPVTIRWHELGRALTLLDVVQEKLAPLHKAMVQQLLYPLIRSHGDAILEIERSSDSYPSSSGSSISLKLRPGEGSDDIISAVMKVFHFIHRDIFLNDYTSSTFNSDGSLSDTNILTRVVGRSIAKEACGFLLSFYLSRIVPEDADGLKSFETIGAKVVAFENELIALGFLSETDREIRDFVEHIDIYYADKKRDALMKLGRAVIMSDDFGGVHVKDLDENDELERDNGRWGRIRNLNADIRDTCISIKAKKLVEMILQTLHEAESQDSSTSPRLYQATRSLIDLYRALMPVHHARALTQVPALGILFYSDCMYIARELEKIPERFEEGIPGLDDVQYDDIAPALKALAERWLELQVRGQREELMQSLDESGGFQDSSVDANFSACERSMKQIILAFRHLGKAWKSTLAPLAFYRVMGELLNDVVKRVITDIEQLGDISERESHKLALLCGQLFECEDQFDSAGPLVREIKGESYEDEDPVHLFVASWEKFQVLTDVLELSFAEIMTRFRAGQLQMFNEEELSELVCALFADTPLRQHNLEEISHGHPRVASAR
ncbi:protein transport protein DSL1/ZW10 [Entomortierella parvispora]|uniref:Protein transport protein DSL1/ZW10 n=1 Tax=Entomortierella parvispora TaxID=205924 RepID=A0A9P3H5P2_9FUNG|nr:protein transport protein DSL1/ZW10 [Entomortierella parvispora]